MDQQDRNMIEGLFDRLRQAEEQSGPRDAEAEALIRTLEERQPAAPYYMAQAILVQEQALQNLQHRIEELERELAERPAGGGFLAGLFGGGAPRTPPRQPWSSASQPDAGRFRQSGSGFLGSALQTGAAVVGGVLLGNAVAGLVTDEAQAAEPLTDMEGAAPDEEYPADDFGDDEF